MFLLLVRFVCIGSFLKGRCGCGKVGCELARFLYSVVTFCLSAYKVPVCHFASRLLDAFCSSLFVVVEGVTLS